MKAEFVKRSILIVMWLGLLFVTPSSFGATGDAWTKIRSPNFLVIGNAGEPDVRRVAVNLERFHEAFTRLLPKYYFDLTTPTVVIVFRDQHAYAPFKPLYRGQLLTDVAGYFQPGTGVNYITLSVDQRERKGSLSVAFHEYVHLLVRNGMRNAPLWFREGIAEYYSASDLTGTGKKIVTGKPIDTRLAALGRGEFLPLATLLEVDSYSPYYTEPGKRGLFYAESWALVHYLLSGRNEARRTQLTRFLDLLAGGASTGEGFRQAFDTDFATLDNELKSYIRRGRYERHTTFFDEPLKFDTPVEGGPITEAEAEAHLGDLLLHADRFEAAEDRLRQAIELDSHSAPAQTSLGVLRLRQNRFGEAKQHLKRAIEIDEENAPAHYRYAEALMGEAAESDYSVKGYAEKTNVLRAELRRAIDLAPRFVEAYRLLAQVELERGLRLDEAVELLEQASALAPKRPDLELLLAQAHLRTGGYGVARQILGNLLGQKHTAPRLRAEAEELREAIAIREEAAARHQTRNDGTLPEFARRQQALPCDLPEAGPQLKKLNFDGEQRCGRLIRIECRDEGVTLSVEVEGRTLKLRSAALNRIRFVSYTAEVKGRIECGAESPAPTPVLVTYRAARDAQREVDGEVLAVEFVPPEWNH